MIQFKITVFCPYCAARVLVDQVSRLPSGDQTAVGVLADHTFFDRDRLVHHEFITDIAPADVEIVREDSR